MQRQFVVKTDYLSVVCYNVTSISSDREGTQVREW